MVVWWEGFPINAGKIYTAQSETPIGFQNFISYYMKQELIFSSILRKWAAYDKIPKMFSVELDLQDMPLNLFEIEFRVVTNEEVAVSVLTSIPNFSISKKVTWNEKLFFRKSLRKLGLRDTNNLKMYIKYTQISCRSSKKCLATESLKIL